MVSAAHEKGADHAAVGQRHVRGAFGGEDHAAVVHLVRDASQEAPDEEGDYQQQGRAGEQIGRQRRYLEGAPDLVGRPEVQLPVFRGKGILVSHIRISI